MYTIGWGTRLRVSIVAIVLLWLNIHSFTADNRQNNEGIPVPNPD